MSGILYYSFAVFFYDAALYVYKISNINLKISLPALSVLIIGYLLFIFRQKKRLLYGFSEVIVGVMAAVLHAQRVIKGESSLNSPELYLAVLTASVYLIVRGLENMSIGIKDKANYKILNKIFANRIKDK